MTPSTSLRKIPVWRKRLAIAAVSICALALTLSWLLFDQPEPEYEGKPLRFWLAGLSSTIDGRQIEDAEHAMHSIGTNSIPILLGMLQKKDSTIRTSIGKSSFLVRLFRLRPVATEQHLQAQFGFRVLGSTASNAVPRLVEIYTKKSSPSSQRAVLESLGHIGTAAIGATPLLMQAVTNSDPMLRSRAMGVLLDVGLKQESVLPIFLIATKDPASDVRLFIVLSLEKHGVEDVSLPVLENSMRDQRLVIRRATVEALKKTNFNSEKARDILDIALQDPDARVRLESIDELVKRGVTSQLLTEALADLTKQEDGDIRAKAESIVKRMNSK